MTVPGYWMAEQSGVLRPVIEKYLRGERLTGAEVATFRAYLRQWIAGDFVGAGVDRLRERVHTLETDADVRAWYDEEAAAAISDLRAALAEAFDPTIGRFARWLNRKLTRDAA